MSRTMKIWLCLLVTALTILAVSQVLSSRHVVAQGNPPPDPLPTPDESSGSCCGIMMPGGQTIGGPGRGGADHIFMSLKPKDICVTIENNNPNVISVAFYATLRVGAGGAFGFEDPILSRHLFIGETATVCSDRVRGVSVNCPGDVVLCPGVGWRVDSAQ